MESQVSTDQQPPTANAPVQNTPQKGASLTMILSLLLLLATAIAVFFYWQNTKLRRQLLQATVQSTPTPLPSPTTDSTTNWKTYASASYQVQYPSDLEERKPAESVFTVVKWGPTQTDGTELFDGYAITFQTVETSFSPKEYADAKIKETTSFSDYTLVEGLTETSINGLAAYTFTWSGNGVFEEIILSNEEGDELVQISISISDPGDVGFRETVDQILATFEFANNETPQEQN